MFPDINYFQKNPLNTIFNTESAKLKRSKENRNNNFSITKNIFHITSISKKTKKRLPQFDFLLEIIDKQKSNTKNDRYQKKLTNNLFSHYRNNYLKLNTKKFGKKKLIFQKAVTTIKNNYSHSAKKKLKSQEENLYEITSPSCFQHHPKNYKSLNEIFIFDDAPKNDNKKLEGRIPMAEGLKYKEYLSKRKKINLNIISNSSYAQKVCTKYLMNKIDVDNQKQDEINKKYIIKEKKENLLDLEMRDTVEFEPIESRKILRTIKEFLRGGVKLNQRNLNLGNFYEFLENKINFVLDSNRLPNIRNNLIKILMSEDGNNKYLDWNYTNAIGYPTLEYLYKLKKKIQIQKDEKTEMIRQNDLIKKKYKYYKKLESENFHGQETIKKILFKNCYAKKDGNFVDIDKEIENESSDPFLIKDFFSTKNSDYEMIKVASKKLKNFVFKNYPADENDIFEKKENKKNGIFFIKSS